MSNRALLAEFIGTAALIFVGAGAAAIGVGGLVGVALAHGLVLTVMVYSYGPISGAHINPAVTLAISLSGELPWSDALRYWLAQLLGGAVGAAGLLLLLGSESSLGATVPAEGVFVWQAILVEALLTFLLVNTILHTAIKGQGTPFAGLAIGLTLVAAILMGGPLTGASLNPARTFGPALFTGTLNLVWIYLLGTSLGAALAALVYRTLK
jgi:aquaporin Z